MLTRSSQRISDPMRYTGESTIVCEGFKVGTRGAPIMPRDASLSSDSKCWNGGHEWVELSGRHVSGVPVAGSVGHFQASSSSADLL